MYKLFFTLLLGMLCCPLPAQIQKGVDIDGEAPYDHAGHALSMPDANTVAIGSTYNDGSGLDAGHVRVYNWNNGAWTPKGNAIEGESPGDESGISISMPDANTIAIGAPKNNGGGIDAGHVRVYQWDGTAWSQKGLDINGEAGSDFSGWPVSMPDANTLAIGARYNDGGGIQAGQVRVYEWVDTAWVQKGADIDGPVPEDLTGWSVSMPDANTVAVATPANFVFRGRVRIYAWNGTAWIQKGSPIDGVTVDENAGWSISMPDPNTIAVGAPQLNSNNTHAGHLRIYAWNGNTWVQKGTDINGQSPLDYLGWSVTMPNPNTVAVGAPSDGNNFVPGLVRVFSWDGAAWVQMGNTIYGEAGQDNAGWSVSMPDPSTVAIGAHQNSGNGTYAGHARIYSLCSHTTGSISQDVCQSYTSPSGNYTWTSPGTYNDTIPNLAGCDSVITIHLTIHIVDTSVTFATGTYTATATGSSYQWVNCPALSPIVGATGQSFAPGSNGSYAVIIDDGTCSDTSSCHNEVIVGRTNQTTPIHLNVFPNPSLGQVSIVVDQTQRLASFALYEATGKLLMLQRGLAQNSLTLDLPDTRGIYFLKVTLKDGRSEYCAVIRQ